MGRYYYDKKATVDGCRSIDVFFLRKHGYFDSDYRGTISWWRNGESNGSISVETRDQERMRIWYTQTDRETGEEREKDYWIKLDKTPCHFGECRYWFLCNFCGRRIGKLYLYGKNELACRHCLKLSYAIRNVGGIEKKIGKVAGAYELDEMKAKIRNTHYRGKPTKRYVSFLMKSDRFEQALMLMAKMW